jgi:hypothetical protein
VQVTVTREPIRPLSTALPRLTETVLPSRGEFQARSAVECPQPAWISRPSSSTGKRTSSRVGAAFPAAAGSGPGVRGCA